MTLLLLVGVLAFGLLSLSPHAYAATAVSGCEQFLYGGSWVLTSDLTGCNGEFGVDLNGAGTSLDCQGYSITGSGTYGIIVPNQLNGASITNCTVSGFSGEGYFISGVSTTVTDDVATNNGVGFFDDSGNVASNTYAGNQCYDNGVESDPSGICATPAPPGVSVSPTSGLPGTVVTVSGSNFVAGTEYEACLTSSATSSNCESTSALFTAASDGSIPASTKVTIPYQLLPFGTSPTGTPGGQYYIIVATATASPPVTASAPFTVIGLVPTLSLTVTSGQPGTQTYLSGTEYLPNAGYSACLSSSATANDCVTGSTPISFDASSGGVIPPGSALVTIPYGIEPYGTLTGTYYVIVTNGGSVVSSAVFNVVQLSPNVSISSSSGLPGSTTTITGTGYLPGAGYYACISSSSSAADCLSINTEVDFTTTGGVIPTSPTPTTVTVPYGSAPLGTPGGHYFVIVVTGVGSTVLASQPYTVVQDVPTLSLTSNTVSQTGEVTVTGTEYVPGVTYDICISSSSSSIACLNGQGAEDAGIPPSSSGYLPTFPAITLQVPFGTPAGSYWVIASTDNNNPTLVASQQLSVVAPSLSLSPTSGQPGSTTSLTGEYYSDNTSYQACLSSSATVVTCVDSTHGVSQFIATSTGALPSSAAVTIPSGIQGGSYYVVVYYTPGGGPKLTASAPFAVTLPPTLTVSPATVPAYTDSFIAFRGANYAPGTYSACLAPSLSTSSCISETAVSGFLVLGGGSTYAGTINLDLEVPPTTTPGSYYVLVYNGTTVYADASFTATPMAVTGSIACPGGSVTVDSQTTCTLTIQNAATGAPAPSGTVSLTGADPGSFSPNPCTLASTSTNGTSACSFSYTPAPGSEGTNIIGGFYGGDSAHLSVGVEPYGIEVVQVSTTDSVVCSPSSTVVDSPVTCTATVLDSAPNPLTPTGAVSFISESSGTFTSNSCTLTSQPDGSSACSVGYNPAVGGGSGNLIDVTYSGDTDHSSALPSPATFSLTVNDRATSMDVVCSPSPDYVANQTTCTATVSDVDVGTPSSPDGVVSIASDGSASTPSPECTLAPATASTSSCSVSYTPTLGSEGSHSFTATYPGGQFYLGTSTTFSLAYSQRPTTMHVDCGPTGTITTLGNQALCTAVVFDAAGFLSTPYPTGTVTFTSDNSGTFTPPTCLLSTFSPGESDCYSVYTPSSGSAGVHNIGASFLGSTDYASSAATTFLLTVEKATPSFSTTVYDSSSKTGFSGEETGASAYDTSRLSSLTEFAPAGSVSYELFSGNSCTGSALSTFSVTLSGLTIPASASTGALGAGQYSFSATYSGDSNYFGSTSSCEPFSVAKAQPLPSTIVDDAATSAPWSGSEVTGAQAFDTASVSGVTGFTPGGQLTYEFFGGPGCAGAQSDSLVVIGSSGAWPNSRTTSPLAAGSYSFEALYGGDANYVGSTSPCEQFSVAKAPTTLGTRVYDADNFPWSGNEMTGASAFDAATVTFVQGFGPSGSATFTFFTNGGCSGSGQVQTEPVSVSQPGVAYSEPTGPLAASTYSFIASYSGDSSYLPSTGTCEPFTVLKAPTILSTAVDDASTSSAWSGSEVTGAAAYDTGFVQVLAPTTLTPAGTVTYQFFVGGTCFGGAQATGTVVLSGPYSVPSSPTTSPLAAGSYSFIASYSGDANFLGGTSACAPFTVSKATLAVSTAIYDATTSGPWQGNEVTGASAYDTASVSGAVEGFTPTGSVNYELFGTGCSGNPVSSAVSLSPNGSIPQSPSSSALGAGPYGYTASYSGDSNYNAAAGSCESFTVGKSTALISTTVNPSASVTLGTPVSDTAMATGTSGFAPTGTVTITLYPGSSCSGSAVSSAPGIGLGSPSTAVTLAVGKYSYLASGYSGDSNYLSGSSGPCEPFMVGPSPSSTSATCTPNTMIIGSSTTCTATVTGHSPTGTVTFTSTSLAGAFSPTSGQCTLSGGSCSVSYTDTSAGVQSIKASYGGDTNNLGSSATTSLTENYKACSQVSNNGGQNLKGADLEYCNLAGLNLSGDNLMGANMQYTNLAGANLKGANMMNVDVANSNLQGANLSGTNLQGATLDGDNAAGANFQGANLKGDSLQNGVFTNCNFQGANMMDDNLSNSHFDGSNFTGANTNGDITTGATFAGATNPP